MKKSFVLLGLVLVIIGLAICGYLGTSCDTRMSDNDLVEMYMDEVHGEGDYDIFIEEGTDDEGIYYMAYEDGSFVDMGWLDRDDVNAVVVTQK